MKPKSLRLTALTRALCWLLVGLCGALEGKYGRTEYLGDWISYLNVSRAVSALDWKGMFNPMWNPGYPALVALARLAFPRTPEGEWNAITLLNCLIFIMAYACWLSLIRRAVEFYDPSMQDLANHPAILWLGCCAFLSCVLCFDNPSAVCPDLLVTALFLSAAAQTLAVINRPGATRPAILLGVTLGVGYWTKNVFLSFAAIFLSTLLLALVLRKAPLRRWVLATLTCLLLYIPYVAAVSWSYGQLTLGVSGELNYAFHVNHIPHWMNWQGGPAVFGTPVHATVKLVPDLPVFEFAQPFRTTYPPYNNLAYWYVGVKKVFNARLQALAVARSLYFLALIVRSHKFLCALLLSLLVVLLTRPWRMDLKHALRRFWVLFLPAVLGSCTYLLMHVEDRYLSAFCLIFSLIPLLPLLHARSSLNRLLLTLILFIYFAGTIAELRASEDQPIRAALHGEDFHVDPQWKLSTALLASGLKENDPVALIDSGGLAYRCHWAYVAHLRIIAEFGSIPWQTAPWDRTPFDRITSEPADEDFGVFFWKRLPFNRRQDIVNAFRRTGARAIICISKPQGPVDEGWEHLYGTGAWIYPLDLSLAVGRSGELESSR